MARLYRTKAQLQSDILRQAKECGNCHDVKPFERYNRHAGSKDGRSSICKDCRQRQYLDKTRNQRKRYRSKKQIQKDIERQSKKCGRCREEKPFSEFSDHAKATDGVSHTCKACRSKYAVLNRAAFREVQLQYKYGITDLEFREKLEAQGNVCAICKEDGPKATSKLGKKIELHVDHCHTTGKIRGILCSKCNSGLGMFGDSLEGLTSAFEYLKRAEEAV